MMTKPRSLVQTCLLLSLFSMFFVACGGGGDPGGGGGGSQVSSLTTLEFQGVTLVPAFDPETTAYAATLPSTTSEVVLSAATAETGQTITVNGTLLGSGTAVESFALGEGNNLFRITVVSSDLASVRTYDVTLERLAPPQLDGLSLSVGTLVPAFSPTTTSYAASASFLETAATVTASVTAAQTTITVDGTTLASGGVSAPIQLGEGPSFVTVRVQNELGEQRDYTVTINRAVADAFAQQAYLKASDFGADDYMGSRIVIDGDTMAVSAQSWDGATSDCGAVYVFVRNGSSWQQQARLSASTSIANEYTGRSLALDGDTLAVGTRGRVLVFQRSGVAWSEVAVLDGPATSSSVFGSGVALKGDTMVVGDFFASAPGVGNCGAAYVFDRSGSSWTLSATLYAANKESGAYFGASVVLDGDSIAVAGPFESSPIGGINSTPQTSSADYGAVYVFTGSGNSWAQQAYIKPASMVGVGSFGLNIDMQGGRLVVGSAGSSSSGASSDRVWVFHRDGAVWSELSVLTGFNTSAGDEFSGSVAIDGDTIAVGAPVEASSTTGTNPSSNNAAGSAGAVYLFAWNGSSWGQRVFLKPSNTTADARFGQAVALRDGQLAVGASFQDLLAANSGAAYVFR